MKKNQSKDKNENNYKKIFYPAVLIVMSLINYIIIINPQYLIIYVPLVLFIMYSIIISLLKSKNIISILSGFILSFSIILCIFGLIVIFLGSSYEDRYIVNSYNVLDIRDNKILVDISDPNLGDPKIIEINKPLFIKINKGDKIDVRYKKDDIENMHYVLNRDIGEKSISLGSQYLIFTIMLGLIFLAKNFIKNIIKKWEK